MTQPGASVFVSYARKDTDRVRPVCEKLKQDGFVLWIDKDELVPGQQWEGEIVTVIKAARVFLLFLSSTWVDSPGFIQKELKIALDVLQELPSDQVFIVPVRLDDCKVPSELSELNWMDLRGEADYPKLSNALGKILEGKLVDFLVQFPIILGNDGIRKASQAICAQFYTVFLMVIASDKVNQTINDDQEHSAMTPFFDPSGSSIVSMIHVHPGNPAQVARKVRGILSRRLNFIGPFLKDASGFLMLDFFVEKLRPKDLQAVRLSLAVTFLPLSEALPKEVSFVLLHQEMLTQDERRQLNAVYRSTT